MGEAGLYHSRGTARNGRQALETIQQEKPDIVVADVKMPLMDGLTLARTCREKGPLPVSYYLTSFEQFDYVRQAMGAGAVDYLVKLELTPQSLTAALARAAERVKKERALMGKPPAPSGMAEGLRSYQDSFFTRLYAGMFQQEEELEAPLRRLGADLAADRYFWSAVRSARRARHDRPAADQIELLLRQNDGKPAEKLSACYVTGADVLRCNVLFCLTQTQAVELPAAGAPAAGKSQSDPVQLLYRAAAVGGGAAYLLSAGAGPPLPGEWASAALASEEQPLLFAEAGGGGCHCRQDAGGGPGAAVYPGPSVRKAGPGRCGSGVWHLGQLSQPAVGQVPGDAGFVEYITETRIAAAKRLLEKGDKKDT